MIPRKILEQIPNPYLQFSEVGIPLEECENHSISPIDSKVQVVLNKTLQQQNELEILDPLVSVDDIKEGCGDITSILSTDQLTSLAKACNSLEDKNIYINLLLQDLSKFDFSKFDDDNFDYYALEALRQKKISPFQFATLLYFKAGYAQIALEVRKDIQTIKLFEDNEISQRAQTLITSTFPIESILLRNESKLKSFFDYLAEAPISEQCFLLIPFDIDQEKELYRQESEKINKGALGHFSASSIAARLRYGVKFNLFGAVLENNISYLMIPSFTMIEAYLKKACRNAMGIKPVLGLPSSEMMLKTQQSDRREISIPFTAIPLPKIADYHSASSIDFFFHEIYHLKITSGLPQPLRKSLLELAEFMLTCTNDIEYGKLAQSIFSVLVDLEVAEVEVLHLTFWGILYELLKDLVPDDLVNRERQRTKSNLTREEAETKRNDFSRKLLESRLYEKIALYIHSHKEKWAKEYGVSIQKLFIICKTRMAYLNKKCSLQHMRRAIEQKEGKKEKDWLFDA